MWPMGSNMMYQNPMVDIYGDDPRLQPGFGTGELLQPGYGSGAPMGGMPQYEEMQFQPFKNGNWAMPMMQAGAALLSSGGRDFGAAMGTFGQGLLAERARQQALHDRDYGREMEQWKTEYSMERDEEADRRYKEKFGYQQEQDEYKKGQDVYDQGQDAQAQANWEAEFGAEGDEAAARQAYNDRIAALRERELALREARLNKEDEAEEPYTNVDRRMQAAEYEDLPPEIALRKATLDLDRVHGRAEPKLPGLAGEMVDMILVGGGTLDQALETLQAQEQAGKLSPFDAEKTRNALLERFKKDF